MAEVSVQAGVGPPMCLHHNIAFNRARHIAHFPRAVWQKERAEQRLPA